VSIDESDQPATELGIAQQLVSDELSDLTSPDDHGVLYVTLATASPGSRHGAQNGYEQDGCSPGKNRWACVAHSDPGSDRQGQH
jgi:hypothetical protein